MLQDRRDDPRISPSPGTPGEGRREGSVSIAHNLRSQKNPHPNPLPEYRERGQDVLYLLLLPTFLLLSIFSFVPFVLAFAASLCQYEVGESPVFVGLSNYREYFSDQTLVISFSNMLFLTSFALAMTIVVPLTVAKLIFSLSSQRASYFY